MTVSPANRAADADGRVLERHGRRRRHAQLPAGLHVDVGSRLGPCHVVGCDHDIERAIEGRAFESKRDPLRGVSTQRPTPRVH